MTIRRETCNSRAALLVLGALALLLPASVLAPGNAAWAASELEESDDLPSVQNRLYRAEIELNAGIGILPIDPFYKGLQLEAGLAWHFTDLWAVDGQFFYLQNFKTSLREDLEGNFNQPSDRFSELRWYAQLGVLFKPLYGKLALFNRSLVYGELYVSLHATLARLAGGEDNGAARLGERLGYGGAPGFGLRGYLNEYLSLRFDLRSNIIYSAGEMHYPLSLMLSFAVSTRSDL